MAQTWPQIALPDYPNEIQADPRELSFSREQLLKMYSAMSLARTFEEKLAALYRQGKIFGAVYLGMGQEATSVGSVRVPGNSHGVPFPTITSLSRILSLRT